MEKNAKEPANTDDINIFNRHSRAMFWLSKFSEFTKNKNKLQTINPGPGGGGIKQCDKNECCFEVVSSVCEVVLFWRSRRDELMAEYLRHGGG